VLTKISFKQQTCLRCELLHCLAERKKNSFFKNNLTGVQNIALECVLHMGEVLWFKRERA